MTRNELIEAGTDKLRSLIAEAAEQRVYEMLADGASCADVEATMRMFCEAMAREFPGLVAKLTVFIDEAIAEERARPHAGTLH